TPTIGRSHGIHAEPTTFGLKLATYYAEFSRNRTRLEAARREIATCAISGAVGTFANIDPFVEEYVAGKLGLAVEPVSTQVIPRDRHAAFFAALGVAASSLENLATDEGRNFQFAHHLVLFDLPLDPSVLEQRIGRLDRIGQKSDIHIHIPYLRSTPHEVVFRWYHEGINAFQDTVLGADYFHEALIGKLLAACESSDLLENLLEETRELVQRVRETLEKGRDRLLELNSNKSDLATDLIAEIHEGDGNEALQEYLTEVFDHFGLDVQDTAVPRGQFVFPGERMLLDTFPGIPESGLGLTYDRGAALTHEDLAFASIDHPLVRSAVDLLLEGEDGTTGFVEWVSAPKRGLALEAVFLLEAAAPGALHIDRFLPPTPIRVLVNDKGENLISLLAAMDAAEPDMASALLLEEHHTLFEELVPKLLDAAREQAALKEASVKKSVHQEAGRRLIAERDRLRDLQAMNPAVSDAEVDAAGRHADEVLRHIAQAELRLDAVRLVLMGKMGM
ncbi:MAG TPA: hypothetical protein DCQ83_06010, partial [Fibrobacteres bacterium]|nr:hypothetical protein [Fibrobacterota bacterium]